MPQDVQAEAFELTEKIVEHLQGKLRIGDVVLVMSNGSFDGLCKRLLGRLRQQETKS